MNRDKLIEEWYKAQELKTRYVTAEKKLRTELAIDVFSYDEDEHQKGTEHHPLDNGYQLKIQFTLNESIDQNEVANARQELLNQGLPIDLINTLFVPTYKVAKAVLKGLPQPAQDVVEMITTRKAGLPKLSIESPKQ